MYMPLPRKAKTGAPAWVVTFADLMALLTTFFVLLLSFSELDVKRYRQIVHSMTQGFGISWLKTEPVKQDALPPIGAPQVIVKPIPVQPSGELVAVPMPQAVDPAVIELLNSYSESLKTEISDGLLNVRHNERGEVVISFRHEAAFESGSATLIRHFARTIDKIADLLNQTQGMVIIAGHTDDLPIRTEQFRSNWDLSTARAVSVVHRLLQHPGIRADRLVAEGYAETQPVVENDSPSNRARNRRVEIRVRPISSKHAETKP